MTTYVLDTNIISLLLRHEPVVLDHFSRSLVSENTFLACPMVWYEIRRGLLAKDARKQMMHFEQLFEEFIWQDFTRDDWGVAAKLWAQRTNQGLPITDADLLIGAFTIVRDAVLVTNNQADFAKLGIHMENWTALLP